MSLLQFGFRVVQQSDAANSGDSGTDVPHLPSINESGFGLADGEVARAVSDLSNPLPAKRGNLRGSYTKYTPKQRANIGRYALENGNERARRRFSIEFPKLTKSAIRNFKKSFKELQKRNKELMFHPVTEIVSKTRGRPPIRREDDHLFFLN